MSTVRLVRTVRSVVRVGLLSALTVSALAQAPLASAHSNPVYKCDGKRATIVGTEGHDELIGTDGPDVIVALGGNDRIYGAYGDDIICAGKGDDIVYGRDGDLIRFQLRWRGPRLPRRRREVRYL